MKHFTFHNGTTEASESINRFRDAWNVHRSVLMLGAFINFFILKSVFIQHDVLTWGIIATAMSTLAGYLMHGTTPYILVKLLDCANVKPTHNEMQVEQNKLMVRIAAVLKEFTRGIRIYVGLTLVFTVIALLIVNGVVPLPADSLRFALGLISIPTVTGIVTLLFASGAALDLKKD